MVRKASAQHREWQECVLASPWVSELTGEIRCGAVKGYVHKRFRGDPEAYEKYRCSKRARFKFKSLSTRSMLIEDATSGNYCANHLLKEINDHPHEKARFEKFYERWKEKHR